MLIGISLPQAGAGSGPESVLRAAQRAEELGYACVWVAERLLYPIEPRSPYPASPDGSLPVFYKQFLTPIETLTYVAAHTQRIAIGTSVLIMPLHNPIMLARQLATLDVLSGGRVRVGLGQGWSIDEFEAAGAAPGQRGARADEFLQVLKAIWTTDPAEFSGQYYTLPKSILQPKPVQQPHPPIYLAAYAPSALERVARLADGWIPGGIPLTNLGPMMDQVRELAQAGGRDPHTLQLVLLAFPAILERSPGSDRPDFVGTLDEIGRDVAAARGLGVAEIIFAPGYTTGDLSLDEYFEALERLRTLA